MGRRKIEIQPILHDRNRSVTFLKRKNGLFKKAYELGVLCSVDVVVIVFGHNQKLYEYSSAPTAPTEKIIEKRLNYTGEKEARGPHDFGSDKVDADGDADGLGDDDSDDQVLSPQSARPGGTQQRPSSTKTPSSAKLGRQSPTHHTRDTDFIDESHSNGGPSGSSMSRDRASSQSKYQQQQQQQQQQHQHQQQQPQQPQQHDNSLLTGAGGPSLSLAHLLAAGGGGASLNINPSAGPAPYDLSHFTHPQFSDPLSASQSLAHLLTANPYLASQLSSLSSYHSHLSYPPTGPAPFPMHPFGPPGGPGSAGPGSVPLPGAPHMNGVGLPGIGGYPLHPLYSSPLFATLLAQQQQQQQHHQHHQHQQNPNALFPLHPPMPREHSHSVDHDGRSPRPMSTDWSLHQQQQHHGYNRPIKRESSLDRSDNRGASRQSGGDNGADSVGGGGIPRSSRSPSPSSHSRGDYAAGMTTNPGSGTGPASSSQKSGATWLDFLSAISSQPAASMATHPSSATGLPGIGIGLPGINSFPPFGSPLNPGAMNVGNISTGGIGAVGGLGLGSLGAESPHPGVVGYPDIDSPSGAAFSATATSGYDSPRVHKRRRDQLDDSNMPTGGSANLGGSSALASPPSSSPDTSRARHTADSSASLADVEFDFPGGMDGEDDKNLDPDYVENAMSRRAPAKRTRVT